MIAEAVLGVLTWGFLVAWFISPERTERACIVVYRIVWADPIHWRRARRQVVDIHDETGSPAEAIPTREGAPA